MVHSKWNDRYSFFFTMEAFFIVKHYIVFEFFFLSHFLAKLVVVIVVVVAIFFTCNATHFIYSWMCEKHAQNNKINMQYVCQDVWKFNRKWCSNVNTLVENGKNEKNSNEKKPHNNSTKTKNIKMNKYFLWCVQTSCMKEQLQLKEPINTPGTPNDNKKIRKTRPKVTKHMHNKMFQLHILARIGNSNRSTEEKNIKIK